MTSEEMNNLQPGDIVRHRNSADAAVVTGNYGKYRIAVRTYHVTNPDEWLLIQKAEKPEER